MAEITDAMLKEWEARCRAATRESWKTHWKGGNDRFVYAEHIGGRRIYLAQIFGDNSEVDAHFIAAARTALPLLIAEIRRLRHGE